MDQHCKNYNEEVEDLTSIKQESNILKYRKKKHLNIGIVIFGIISIYLLATIIMYVTAPRVTVYEVRQGSILKDHAYTALALREETVVYADTSGYINYYTENNSKVKNGSNVYSISSEPLTFEKVDTEEQVTLSQKEEADIISKIQNYTGQFQENNYASTYQLHSDVQNTLDTIASQSKLDLVSATGKADLVKSPAAGVIVYSVDGLEGLQLESLTAAQLKKTDYHTSAFQNNDSVTAGDPIYKLITENQWQLVCEITEETTSFLEEKSRVKVCFKKDNQETWANFELLQIEGKNVLCLSFEDSMIRYSTERYVDIELILENQSGLKIPKSAETSKEFYIVPSSYITQGGNSNSEGVMRKTKNAKKEDITEFYPVTIYYEKDEMVYLDPNDFEEGDILLKPESQETYALTVKESLKGVYSINKGYAVFKQIHILTESEEYYIIEEGNSFGLSNYDHIALESADLNEGDVVF